MGTLANSEDPDEMLHNVNFIRVYTVCLDKIFKREEIQCNFYGPKGTLGGI